ncbi:hypothetical protein SAMN05192586_10898 [Desulfovibrio legallii]|jgi:hypothetical protein|uniref:Uncharacterized protein n=1 Tax=Desulfovibrio legallii TaxID=571438 RepID=A0A1G7MF79_9BACT|nr:hypothetical protein SAMN05192586_10898 [Desulfovibrio legallii]
MWDLLVLIGVFGGVAAFYILALRKGWLRVDRMSCG